MRFFGSRSVLRVAFISLLALSSLGIACLAWDPVSGLTPDDLPMDGEVLVVGKDARLEIPIGSAATINGTIRAMGNSTYSPRLSIDNQGNLTVQRAMMESLNSRVVITNKGTVSGNGLGLHPGRGGSINRQTGATSPSKRSIYSLRREEKPTYSSPREASIPTAPRSTSPAP